MGLRAMKSYERALEALSQPTQRTSEPSYAASDHSRCWRCLREAGKGPSGVCDACRAVLLADLPPEEPEYVNSASLSPNPGYQTTSEAVSALTSAFGLLFDQIVACVAESLENLRVSLRSGDETGEITVIGTRWAENDLYVELLRNDDGERIYRSVGLQVVQEDPE